MLPSIRKTGAYAVSVKEPTRLEFFKQAMEAEQQRLLLAEQKQELEHQMVEDAPHVAFAKQIEVSHDSISVAKAAKIIGTGQKRLFAFMRQIGWITRQNEPYQVKIDQGYLDVKLSKWDHPDFGLTQSVTSLLTGKGLVKIQRLWAERQAA